MGRAQGVSSVSDLPAAIGLKRAVAQARGYSKTNKAKKRLPYGIFCRMLVMSDNAGAR
jgi:hypothetical protein